MWRSRFFGKFAAVTAMVLLLAIALARIGFLVSERQGYQLQAVQSVQQSFAGAQTLVGPVLQRTCSEEWEATVGEGKDRRSETRRREFTLAAVPGRLAVEGDSRTELRQRGLYKVNGYAATLRLDAHWPDLAALTATREHAGSRLSCRRPLLWLATTDVRGLRRAEATSGGRSLAVKPGTGSSVHRHGLQVELDEAADRPDSALTIGLTIELLGTAQLALVPAAENTRWTLRSDWPHPSFGGRFLPSQREVAASGFTATWALSALATASPVDLLRGAALCGEHPHGKPCLDTLAVAFVDPVNPYTLSDRAIKYGLLFVVLTLGAVGLAEALGAARIRRVHPVQYGLVGAALVIFFLLLLSLSEHIAFAHAYAVASVACVALLAVYARHMFGRLRDGASFGAGVAVLYGLLYLLLQREQTALVIGAIGLFVALAAVMWLTRRVDWYQLGRAPDAQPAAAADAQGPA